MQRLVAQKKPSNKKLFCNFVNLRLCGLSKKRPLSQSAQRILCNQPQTCTLSNASQSSESLFGAETHAAEWLLKPAPPKSAAIHSGGCSMMENIDVFGRLLNVLPLNHCRKGRLLPAFFSACLPSCLTACLLFFLPVCLPACLSD